MAIDSVLTLQPTRLIQTPVPLGTSWLLADCMEARGKQDLGTRQTPEVLAVLRKQAIVQSVESSNRIEGVTVEPNRLRPVILGKSRPRDRSEEELAGYRRALDWIFSLRGHVDITPDVIRKLHVFAQGGSTGDAGEWKQRNNEIIEISPSGERRVRFLPATPGETPDLVEHLCENLRDALEGGRVPPLLLAATFIFDLLCIHPFRDGNGRVSRLATTLLLQSNGFEVGRYVSLERLVEESKETYYQALEHSSRGWHDGRNEILPWWNYFLGIVRTGYRQFETQVGVMSGRPAKGDLVRRTVLEQSGDFSLAGLVGQLPGVSTQLIKKVLGELKSEGVVRLQGRGRGATWRVVKSFSG